MKTYKHRGKGRVVLFFLPLPKEAILKMWQGEKEGKKISPQPKKEQTKPQTLTQPNSTNPRGRKAHLKLGPDVERGNRKKKRQFVPTRLTEDVSRFSCRAGSAACHMLVSVSLTTTVH